MISAIHAILNKEMGYLKAAKSYNVPKATLEYYCKVENPLEESRCRLLVVSQ